jgi:uncharacterized protein
MRKVAPDLVCVQDSTLGKGIFAQKPIANRSLITRIRGKELTFEDSLKLGERESYCLQVDIDKYIIPDEPFLYSNHSCDPNSGINSRLELIALRPIYTGEEVTWDYSTSMLERHWTMKCHCGSPNCRRLITDFDFLSEQLQKTYLHLGIVLPFLTKYLQQQHVPQLF